MSNLFDNITRQVDVNALKKTAADALSQLGAAGAGVRDKIGRDSVNMLGAGTLGGLLGALLGRGGQKLGGAALALGGTAAVGTLAWSFYQKWAKENAQGASAGEQPAYANPGRAVERGMEAAEEGAAAGGHIDDADTARLLLRAMTYAARADGHMDDAERERIRQTVRQMYPDRDLADQLDTLMREPVDPKALAAVVQSQEQGQDIYRLSCAIVEADNYMERSYLNALAEALHIPDDVKESIEKEAQEARHDTTKS